MEEEVVKPFPRASAVRCMSLAAGDAGSSALNPQPQTVVDAL